MSDALSIPLIIAMVCVTIASTAVLHAMKPNNPVFILAIIGLISSLLILGLIAVLTLFSILGSL